MTSHDRQSPGRRQSDKTKFPDSNATGASDPLSGTPGQSGRETHERQAAWLRSKNRAEEATVTESEGMLHVRAHRLFAALGENVRDFAIFLMDVNGLVRFWGEGARL